MKRAGIRPITGKYKLIHRSGLALMGIGLLVILSVFGTLIAGFGTPGNYEGPGPAAVFRAFGGLIVTIIGRFLIYVAAHGWSDIGYVSKAELARIDAEQRQATIVHPVGTAARDIKALARFEEHRK